jgi:hypothetical protein
VATAVAAAAVAAVAVAVPVPAAVAAAVVAAAPTERGVLGVAAAATTAAGRLGVSVASPVKRPDGAPPAGTAGAEAVAAAGMKEDVAVVAMAGMLSRGIGIGTGTGRDGAALPQVATCGPLTVKEKRSSSMPVRSVQPTRSVAWAPPSGDAQPEAPSDIGKEGRWREEAMAMVVAAAVVPRLAASPASGVAVQCRGSGMRPNP